MKAVFCIVIIFIWHSFQTTAQRLHESCRQPLREEYDRKLRRVPIEGGTQRDLDRRLRAGFAEASQMIQQTMRIHEQNIQLPRGAVDNFDVMRHREMLNDMFTLDDRGTVKKTDKHMHEYLLKMQNYFQARDVANSILIVCGDGHLKKTRGKQELYDPIVDAYGDRAPCNGRSFAVTVSKQYIIFCSRTFRRASETIGDQAGVDHSNAKDDTRYLEKWYENNLSAVIVHEVAHVVMKYSDHVLPEGKAAYGYAYSARLARKDPKKRWTNNDNHVSIVLAAFLRKNSWGGGNEGRAESKASFMKRVRATIEMQEKKAAAGSGGPSKVKEGKKKSGQQNRLKR